MNTFSLPEKITHNEAPSVLADFKSVLQTLSTDTGTGAGLGAEHSFCVDAASLRVFNSAALAVLLALKRELQSVGLELQVTHLPGQLQNLAKVYGVDLFLNAT